MKIQVRVVSIERYEVVIDRETVIEEQHVDLIVDSGAKTILLHKEGQNQSDYAIIYNTLQKDPCNSKRKPYCISTDNFVTPNHPMRPLPGT